MKWYLIIMTNIGSVDCGALGNYYATRQDAKAAVSMALALDFVIGVGIREENDNE